MSQFDPHVPAGSWLHRLDPRAKLWCVLLASIVGLAYRHIGALAGLLLLAHAALLAAHIPLNRLRWIWSRLLPLLLMILILQPMFTPGTGPDLLRVGPVRWTTAGLLDGVSYALRAAALAFVAAALLLTTDSARLVQSLVKLGLPYPWGMTIGLAIRYLPETNGLFVSVMEAQQARGWIIGQGRFSQRVRSYLPVLVATIIASLRKADSLGLALAARGLGYARHRTALYDVQFRATDWLVLALTTAAFAGLMLLRFGLSWGAGAW
jgi:energy-coupling factor transport system permease protein